MDRAIEVSERAIVAMVHEAREEAERRLASRKMGADLSRFQGDLLGFLDAAFEWREGEGPTPYHRDIGGLLMERRKAAVHGPHGLGKTAFAAWAILWAVLVYPEVKVVTTASVWRQLTKFLWPEVHKWAGRLRWGLLGRGPFRPDELQTLVFKLGENRQAFAVASDRADSIEGAHSAMVVYVYDEAKAIPEPIWDATEGAMADGEYYALAISTPGDRAGRFFQICNHHKGYEDWGVRHVTLAEAIEAGRISPEWVDQRRRQWGEDSPVYQARVLGVFPEQSEDQLIRHGWIEAARESEIKVPKDGDLIIGADIARFGDDDSCLIDRRGDCAVAGEVVHGQDTMAISGRLARRKSAKVRVDEIGVGAGVVDRLKELKVKARGVNVGAAAIDREQFANLRAEGFWLLRERFATGQISLRHLPKPLYDRLSGELVAIRYAYTSKGQLKIEPKEEMKKRLGFSPDVADALMLAFLPESGGRLLMSDEDWGRTVADNAEAHDEYIPI